MDEGNTAHICMDEVVPLDGRLPQFIFYRLTSSYTWSIVLEDDNLCLQPNEDLDSLEEAVEHWNGICRKLGGFQQEGKKNQDR